MEDWVAPVSDSCWREGPGDLDSPDTEVFERGSYPQKKGGSESLGALSSRVSSERESKVGCRGPRRNGDTKIGGHLCEERS